MQSPATVSKLTLLGLGLTMLCGFIVACDKQKQAEISDYTKNAASETKAAAVEFAEDTQKAASELKDKVANSEEFKNGKLKINGSWNEAKGRLKKAYAGLTDDDLLYEEGKEEELYGRLERKLGKSREEVKKLLQD
jgi:uncharacterized protein YjbJ (UPF0337 family)